MGIRQHSVASIPFVARYAPRDLCWWYQYSGHCCRTGSGKSYGFQLGALVSIVEERLAGTLETVHSIFIYPRVALMADQREAWKVSLVC